MKLREYGRAAILAGLLAPGAIIAHPSLAAAVLLVTAILTGQQRP